MRSEGYSTWSVRLSVCLSVRPSTFYATLRDKQEIETPTGSALHWLHFNGDFCKSTAFRSYGVKTK